MKILIVTAIHKRPELTRIVLNYYYNEIYKEFSHHGATIGLLACGSSKADESLAMECRWNYCHAPNDPLSQKFNRLFEEAKQYNPDAVLLVGSDDLLSPRIIRYYDQHYDKNCDYMLGLKDIYFYSIQTDRLLYFEGFINERTKQRQPKTIGAGRLFSRKVLEMLNYRPWEDEILPRGLDSACSINLKRKGIEEIGVTMEQTGGIACDFKYGKENLTPFDRLITKGKLVDNFLLSATWKDEFEEIKKLRIPDREPEQGFTLAEIQEMKKQKQQTK